MRVKIRRVNKNDKFYWETRWVCNICNTLILNKYEYAKITKDYGFCNKCMHIFWSVYKEDDAWFNFKEMIKK